MSLMGEAPSSPINDINFIQTDLYFIQASIFSRRRHMEQPTLPARATTPPLNKSGVMVVGGTSGVGLATGIEFGRAGASRVVLVGRNHDRGSAAVKIAREAAPGTEFTFIAADANLPVEAQDAATGAKKFLGNINVLVNSTVAVYQPKLLHETSIDDIPRMLFEQGAGPLVTTRAVIPFLREQGTGSVLSVASDAAKVPTPGETVIGASMAAIVSFTTRQAHLA